MRNISAIYVQMKDRKNSEIWLKKLADLARETSSNIYLIEALGELGILQYEKGDADSCISYLQKCLSLLPEKMTTDTAVVKLYYAKALAIKDRTEQQEYAAIMSYFSSAERFYSKNNSPIELCNLLYDKAVFLSNYNKKSLAAKTKKKGLSLALENRLEEMLKKYADLEI